MGLRISNNLSTGIGRILEKNSNELDKSNERLASGQRINHAGDDAAGMAISESLKGQIRSMGQAEQNASVGTSFSQVAEGGLTEVGNMLIRLRELAIQSASDTVGDRERGYIDQEVKSLVTEVDRISNSTNFNGTPLLNGQSNKGNLTFQVGIHNTENDRINFDVNQYDVRTNTLGIDGLNFTDMDGARDGLSKIDEAMGRVASVRSSLGAVQNRLQSTGRTLNMNRDNLQMAHSRIADTDIAWETAQRAREQILQEAGISVLAQANASAGRALRLLQ